MFFKKILVLSLAASIICTPISAISFASEKENVSENLNLEINENSENSELNDNEIICVGDECLKDESTPRNVLDYLKSKGFSVSSKENASEADIKLNLFENDNLDVALKEGLSFILNDKSGPYIDDKKTLNECILNNTLLKECIESTEKYLKANQNENNRKIEILKRLNSLKKLMEIDEQIPDTNVFYRFISSVKDAYQVLISRKLADEILEKNRDKVESKLGTESANASASISTQGNIDGLTFGLSIGNSNSESSTENSFYRIDNSTNIGASIGASLKGYLGADLTSDLQFTRSLIFLSLEQFLDTNYKDGKITSIELRSPEIKEILKSRKDMQEKEKKLLSNMKTSLEWYLKSSEIVLQKTNFKWPSITSAKDSVSKEHEVKGTLGLNLYAKCLASLGFTVSTDSGVVFTSVPHSYLGLIDEECLPSDYVKSSSDIVKFLKQTKNKKLNEIKSNLEKYLNEDGTFRGGISEEEKVLSIILSNLIGDIRHYNSAISILADETLPKEDRKNAKKIKHKIESDWLTSNELLKLNNSRLEILKSIIAISSYLRQYANTENEIKLFRQLYSEIEYLSKMQIFSESKRKQSANFTTEREKIFNSLNGNVKLDLPLVGTSFVDVSYSDTLSDANFDTSKDLTIQIQLPIINEKVVGTEVVKQKMQEYLEKISENPKLDPKAVEVLRKVISVIEKNYDSILKDLGIERIITVPLVFSVNNYLNLNLFLTKVDATKETDKENLKALPEQNETIIKLDDEWVLKLVKRVDSGFAKLNLNAADVAKVNASARVGRASSVIGTDTFSFITKRYNVFEAGLNDKLNNKENNLWDQFKKNQEIGIKEMLINISEKNKNIRYELQEMYNDIMKNISNDSKLKVSKKNSLLDKVDKEFIEFINACDKFKEKDTQENFETASKALDKILNLSYLYSYLPELNRVHLIK